MPRTRGHKKVEVDTRTPEERLTEEVQWRTTAFNERLQRPVWLLEGSLREMKGEISASAEGKRPDYDNRTRLHLALAVNDSLNNVIFNANMSSLVRSAVELDEVEAKLEALQPPETEDSKAIEK